MISIYFTATRYKRICVQEGVCVIFLKQQKQVKRMFDNSTNA